MKLRLFVCSRLFQLLDVTEDFIILRVVFFPVITHVGTHVIVRGVDLTRDQTSKGKNPSHILVVVRFDSVAGYITIGSFLPVYESLVFDRVH